MSREIIDNFLSNIRANLEQTEVTNIYGKESQFGLALSAVLVPITYQQNEFKLIYTKRASDLARHKGQVSFPGGIFDQRDKNPTDTALRETHEEINIQKDQIEILGMMKPFNSQTGYFIYPIVGFIQDLFGLQRNGREVDRIFCIPIKWLSDPENSKLMDYQTSDGSFRKVWFFEKFDGEQLWGISGLITKSFLELIHQK